MRRSGALQLFFIFVVAITANGQSLGDAARAERARKGKQGGAAKVYTTDDFPDRGPVPAGDTSASTGCNEVVVDTTLGKLQGALAVYNSAYNTFPLSLNQLGSQPNRVANSGHANLLAPELDRLASGGDRNGFETSGYRVTYTPTKPDLYGHFRGYALHARPRQYGITGRSSFFGDQTRLRQRTGHDRAATTSDPSVFQQGNEPRCGPPPPSAPPATDDSSPYGRTLNRMQIGPDTAIELRLGPRDPRDERDRESRIRALKRCVELGEEHLRERCNPKRPSCDWAKEQMEKCQREIDRLRSLGSLPP